MIPTFTSTSTEYPIATAQPHITRMSEPTILSMNSPTRSEGQVSVSTRLPKVTITPRYSMPTNTMTPSPTRKITTIPSPYIYPTNVPEITIPGDNNKFVFILAHTESVGPGPIDMAVDDINKDGNADFINANYDDNKATLLLSLPQWLSYQRRDLVCGEGCMDILIDDLTGDGWKDVALLATIDSSLDLYVGDPALVLQHTDRIFLSNYVPFPNEKVHQGKMQLLASGFFKNLEKKQFAVGYTNAIDLYEVDENNHCNLLKRKIVPFKPLQLADFDMNGDGIDEIVVAHADPCGIAVYSLVSEEWEPVSWLNLEDTMSGNVPLCLMKGDINQDQIPDLVIPT